MTICKPLRFDLIDLRLFLNIVDTGSMTGGSQRSHLALASASARIRSMEASAGLALFERHRTGVRPTQAGRALAHHAKLMLQQVERLQGELLDHSRGLAGSVRLLSNTAALSEYLPQALAGFLRQHPALDIELEERPSHAIVGRLLEGAADLGIVADAVDLSGLDARPLRNDPLVLVTPRAHPLARRRRVGFAEVLDHALISLDDESALQQCLALQAAQIGRRLRARIRLRSFDAICRMVAAGVGIAVIPAVSANSYSGALPLRVIPLQEAWANRRLMLCARDFSTLTASAAKLVDALLA